MPDDTIFKDSAATDAEFPGMALQKWGGLASFLMPVALVGAHLIYLTGDLRDAGGLLSYALADFLYGPVWAVALVTAVYALRERVGERAPRRMTLALLITLAAAGAFVAVACIRAANRHYHVTHPELHLEESATVLIVWATLVAGMIGAAWHFLGWALLLIGSAGWTSRRLPRALSGLYVVAGAISLFVYQFPGLEGAALMLVMVLSIWQGIVLWSGAREGTAAPEIDSRPV